MPLWDDLHELHRQGHLWDYNLDAAALELVNLCSGGYRFLMLGDDEEPMERTRERLLNVFLRGVGLEDTRQTAQAR